MNIELNTEHSHVESDVRSYVIMSVVRKSDHHAYRLQLSALYKCEILRLYVFINEFHAQASSASSPCL
jgi:hypothetical protein